MLFKCIGQTPCLYEHYLVKNIQNIKSKHVESLPKMDKSITFY